jgi:hypothetical protein
MSSDVFAAIDSRSIGSVAPKVQRETTTTTMRMTTTMTTKTAKRNQTRRPSPK